MNSTRVDFETRGRRLAIVGPALAVIALVAVMGVIWLSSKLIDLTEKAILQPSPQQRVLQEGKSARLDETPKCAAFLKNE